MKLFSKKEKPCCCKGTNESFSQGEKTKQEKGIKVLGSGCAKCIALEQTIQKAVNEMNLDLSIEHINDFAQIASYGVMTTPAFVLNGKVVSYGKVLSLEEVKSILSQYCEQ